MPSTPLRMIWIASCKSSVYRVISHTVMDGFPFKNDEKDGLVRMIR